MVFNNNIEENVNNLEGKIDNAYKERERVENDINVKTDRVKKSLEEKSVELQTDNRN